MAEHRTSKEGEKVIKIAIIGILALGIVKFFWTVGKYVAFAFILLVAYTWWTQGPPPIF